MPEGNMKRAAQSAWPFGFVSHVAQTIADTSIGTV